jgi:hypothetical protein
LPPTLAADPENEVELTVTFTEALPTAIIVVFTIAPPVALPYPPPVLYDVALAVPEINKLPVPL